MYDYDLAKAVARNSQMDPKVYLPMLKRLRSLPEFVARFEVDIKLEKYESALDHLYKSGIGTDQMISQDHFDKCLSFVEKHNLHRLGLDLFKSYQTWHQKVMISLGNSLLNTNKPEAALSIFLSARPRYLDGAKRAARACGDWRTFFSVISEDLDMKEEEKQNLAAQIADEISSGKGGLERHEKYVSAARILVDYCEDTYGAVDMLIEGEMWFEARRLASMIDDCELQSQINDAAKSYAQTCISDFYSKKDSFLEADKRYREVVLIRKQARRDGEQVVDDQHDETGSLFSMASNASNLSVSSNMSSSSVGSVSSVSSVISASSVTSFSLVGVEAENRHKSKYNKLGRGGKKKKKKKKATRRERMGLKPGSEEELASLVNKLNDNVISVNSALLIAETIRFLSQVEMTLHGKDLYDEYENLKTCIKQVQEDRVASATLKEVEEEREYRQEGKYYERVILDCEKDVDRLTCADLPREIHDLFSYCIV
jgi:elongator complex protein 1